VAGNAVRLQKWLDRGAETVIQLSQRFIRRPCLARLPKKKSIGMTVKMFRIFPPALKYDLSKVIAESVV
jgi:hypothetical protein